jgi:putative nucleotidyltransferase with HDIG domain
MNDFNLILKKIVDLPSPPTVVQQLQARIAEQDISSKEVASIIEIDQAFTARVLRLVNSPFYGFSRKIISVEEAITMLGFNTVHQLLLTTSLLNSFEIKKSVLDLNKFWMHSFGVGVTAKQLLYKRGKEIRNEGFMCGILHDIGRMVLVKIDPEKFVAFQGNGHKVTDLDAENKFFGIDHQKLGEMLAHKWNFPESIVMAIAKHHDPPIDGNYSILISAVNIADMLCHALSIGDSGSYYISSFSQEAWNKLGIEMSSLENILLKSLNEIDKATDLLNEIHKK